MLPGLVLLLLSTMTATSCVNNAESEERDPRVVPQTTRMAALEDWLTWAC